MQPISLIVFQRTRVVIMDGEAWELHSWLPEAEV